MIQKHFQHEKLSLYQMILKTSQVQSGIVSKNILEEIGLVMVGFTEHSRIQCSFPKLSFSRMKSNVCIIKPINIDIICLAVHLIFALKLKVQKSLQNGTA